MKFSVYLQYLVPQHLLSRMIGWLANSRITWIKNKLIAWFIARYDVYLHEAEITDPFAYQSFNDFFTRKIKSSLRPIDAAANVIVSPADGVISQFGTITNGMLFQAKDWFYSVDDLLGNDEYVEEFHHGKFMNIYLSPRDYHRIHAPFSGKLLKMSYIPGKLFSVNTVTCHNIPNLYARNERMVAIFATEIGLMAVVMIGAMIVAGIHTTWFGKITPNRNYKKQVWHYDQQATPIFLNKGDELGHFELGSTVIVLINNQLVSWEYLVPQDVVQVGKRIGIMNDEL